MFSFYAYPILIFRACLPVTLHCGLGVGIRTQHRSGKGHVGSVGLNCISLHDVRCLGLLFRQRRQRSGEFVMPT